MTHICVSRLTITGSDNGLSPGRRQAIIWTNAGILLIGPLGTNFSENLIEILTFSLTKMRVKVSSAKWRPFCLGLNVLSVVMGAYRCCVKLTFLARIRLPNHWQQSSRQSCGHRCCQEICENDILFNFWFHMSNEEYILSKMSLTRDIHYHIWSKFLPFILMIPPKNLVTMLSSHLNHQDR